jgi:serine/threonine protein kinase
LIAYAVGQIQGPAVAAVAAHLRQCRICRKRVHEEMKNESLLIKLRDRPERDAEGEPVRTPSRSRTPDTTRTPGGTSVLKAIDAFDDLEQCLSNRYKILERVGAGGAGEVYRAYDTLLHRPVAVKVLFQPIDDTAAGDDFMNEARALARLNHPGIVQIHEVLAAAGRPCLVMEWVDGLPITHALHEAALQTKVAVVTRMAEAIAWAHQHGLLHRDLKPSNVLVCPDGSVKIVDFHLALRAEAVLPNDFQYHGTPTYSSPEQFIPGKQIGPSADVFCMGVMLYEVLTGQHPFLHRGSPQVIDSILGDHPERPAVLVPDLPFGLENICLKALEKDPALRYPDAAALAGDLHRYARHEVVWARPSYVADRLQSEIAQHLQRLSVWTQSGFVTERELDSLHQVYDQVLAPKDTSILDTRRLSFSQVCLYLGAWVTTIAASLLVLFEWGHIDSTMRPVPAIGAAALVTGLGAWLWRRSDRRLGMGFFVASNLLTPMVVLAILYHWNLLSHLQDASYEAFTSYCGAFSNTRLLAAALCWLGSSLILLRVTRLSVMTLLACAAGLASLAALYLLMGMKTWTPDVTAGRFLWPSIVLIAIGILCDRRKLGQYAWPCAVIGTMGFVAACLAICASQKNLFGWLWGLPDYTLLSRDECMGLGFVVVGLVFLAVAGGFRTVGTRLFRRLAEGLNWVGSLCVLLPLRVLDNGSYDTSLLGRWQIYEKALPIASLGFVFASVPRQMKPFFFAGLIGLGISIERLTVRHFSDDFRWPIFLILVGLVFMLLAWFWPGLTRLAERGRGRQDGA